METRVVMTYTAAGICLLMGFIIGYITKSHNMIEPECPINLIDQAICSFDNGNGNQEDEGTNRTRSAVSGFIRITSRVNGQLSISGNVAGLVGEHGLHIHEFGNIDDGCRAAGGHFNPYNDVHGPLVSGSQGDAHSATLSHVGDLGNIKFNSNRTSTFKLEPNVRATMSTGLGAIIGRSIVIHQKSDDFGRGGHASSVINGNSGERLACCVIAVDKPSMIAK